MQNLPLRFLSVFTLVIFLFTFDVVPALAAVAYSYDANGNMTSDGNNCYTYNDANQMTQVKNCTTNQVIAQYIYDYQGNRIVKKIYSSGSLQKTVYSPNKTFETVKQGTVSATSGLWTTGSSSNWAAAIVSFNSAGSTPSLVQKNKGNGGGTGSVATAFTGSVTSGHTIVVMTVTGSATNLDTTSVTDNLSNTYTQIGTTQHTSGNQYLRLWYAKNVTGGSVTVTAHQSGSASGCLMEILDYSGLSTTSPADQSASTTGTSTSPSGGSITPSGSNALVISSFIDDNADNVTITGTSGYTVEESDLINSSSSRNGIEDKVVTSGATTTNTSYYFVNDEMAAKKNPDSNKNYFLTDNLGSANVVTNQSGTVVEQTKFYPYGQIRSGGTQSKYLYTGQENDSETGLDYYNSRYYNPQIQRFIQPDTIITDAYDPQSLNRYSYVENNPLTYTDPSGHCLWDLCIVEGIGLVELTALVVGAYVALNSSQISHAVVSAATNGYTVLSTAASNVTKSISTALSKPATTASSTSHPSGNNTSKSGSSNSGSKGGGSSNSPLKIDPQQWVRENGQNPQKGPEGWEVNKNIDPKTGEEKISYSNPETKESLHPDFDNTAHGGKQHWDYTKRGMSKKLRIGIDGEIF